MTESHGAVHHFRVRIVRRAIFWNSAVGLSRLGGRPSISLCRRYPTNGAATPFSQVKSSETFDRKAVKCCSRYASIDYDEFRTTKYFPSLDGLRAISVFLVMFNHVHAVVPPWIFGWLGVDVFFVLSGFLITTLMLREKERNGRVSLKGFYTRRFFRIIPVYLFTVGLYFVAVHAAQDPLKIRQFNSALPWLLTFLQEFRPISTGNVLGHAWTLGIEEKFYIVWPILLMALYPLRLRAIACLGLIYLALLLFPHVYSRSYDGLLTGAVVAITLYSFSGARTVRRLYAVPDAIVCLLIAVTYALNGFSYKNVLLFSASIALLVAVLVLRHGILRRLLEIPPLVFIGKRSYAMYLIHVLVLNVVEKFEPASFAGNAIITVCLAYVATLACAAMMYVVVERPCIHLGRRLSRQFGSSGDSSTVVALL